LKSFEIHKIISNPLKSYELNSAKFFKIIKVIKILQSHLKSSRFFKQKLSFKILIQYTLMAWIVLVEENE